LLRIPANWQSYCDRGWRIPVVTVAANKHSMAAKWFNLSRSGSETYRSESIESCINANPWETCPQARLSPCGAHDESRQSLLALFFLKGEPGMSKLQLVFWGIGINAEGTIAIVVTFIIVMAVLAFYKF
jgi:hypothetical protein